MSALFYICALLAADPPDRIHLAETLLEIEVNEARQKYHEAVQAAHKKMHDALIRAASDARKAGDEGRRLALLDRAALDYPHPDPVDPITGKYEIRYSDGKTETYTFADGKASLASDPIRPEPVRWLYRGELVTGFVWWPGHTKVTVFDVRANGTMLKVQRFLDGDRGEGFKVK